VILSFASAGPADSVNPNATAATLATRDFMLSLHGSSMKVLIE